MTTTAVLPAININISYSSISDSINDFLQHFKSDSAISKADELFDTRIPATEDEDLLVGPKYMNILQRIADREITSLFIDLDDIAEYERLNTVDIGNKNNDQKTLVDCILENTHRYVELFSKSVDKLMPQPKDDVNYKDSVIDLIISQRKQKNERLAAERREQLQENGLAGDDLDDEVNDGLDDQDDFPDVLTRRYNLYFRPLTSNYDGKHQSVQLSVRDVKGSSIGQFITVRGMITRVSDVKPSVVVTAYTCDQCGYEQFQEVNQRTYMPLSECTSKQCIENGTKGKLFQSTRASKFSAFQKVKLQELASQVPVGHIPRTINIHLNGDLVRAVDPGDMVDIAGIFLPIRNKNGFGSYGKLSIETYLEAQCVRQHKKKYDVSELTQSIEDKIERIRSEGDVYNRLAKSIAPEIFGHEDVKKALLLLLVGGVDKKIGDGMKIRGDINVCLMGDPGVAKSQLLKTISKITPRGVYTTGRGSSGVGLTAAVMKDPVTDEMVLEGGALVLADNGICCIDEFDKMDENDRTAIHEVMEQQTISISKAGINTTLNARASILAAANPVFGRFKTNISPLENINLPAALLSRFDIIFLILDTPSIEDDEKLAHHVAYVHMHNKHPEMDFTPLDPNEIREYITKAKSFRPVVPKEVGDYVVSSYIRLRQESKHRIVNDPKKSFGQATPRTLLGILRMAQALARLRFDSLVYNEDVDEALRLIEIARSSFTRDDYKKTDTTPMTRIYQIIQDLALRDGRRKNKLSLQAIRDSVIGKGFNEQQLRDCIEEYTDLNVWLELDDETLMFIGDGADDESDEEMED